MEKAPSLCLLTGQPIQLRMSGGRWKNKTKKRNKSTSRLPWLCQNKTIKITEEKEINKEEEKKKSKSRLQLLCAIWMNVQYVHAALGARRAWPSFSCRCVSTGEACQTPGSPFQRCQRTFQVLSGAGRENKGGENKGGRGREGCLWLAPGPWKTGHEKNDRKQWILSSAHSVFSHKSCLYWHNWNLLRYRSGQSGGKAIPPVGFCPRLSAV